MLSGLRIGNNLFKTKRIREVKIVLSKMVVPFGDGFEARRAQKWAKLMGMKIARKMVRKCVCQGLAKGQKMATDCPARPAAATKSEVSS